MRRLFLTLIFCFLTTPTWAAITVDATSTADATGTSTTHNHTLAADADAIFICMGQRDFDSAIQPAVSVTVGGENATHVAGAHGAANTTRADLYYLVNPPTGTQQIIATADASVNTMATAAISLKGVASTSTLNTAKTNAANSGMDIDVDTLASAVGELGLLCGTVRTNTPTVSPDATAPTSTERVEYASMQSFGQIVFIYTEDGATTSIDMRVDSDTSINWAAAAVSIRAAAEASSFGPLRRRF